MKHILSKYLLTSPLTTFPVLLLSLSLSTSSSLSPAFASPQDEVREHVNRGNLLLRSRHFEDAIAEYEAALKADPNSQVAKDNIALTHNNWGIFLFSGGKYTEAKTHWDTALKLNPYDGNVKRNLKILELRMKQLPPPPQEKPAVDPNPKPSGPQDWNPFDESLEKPANARAQGSTAPNSSSPPPQSANNAGPSAAQVPSVNQGSTAPASNERPSGPTIVSSSGGNNEPPSGATIISQNVNSSSDAEDSSAVKILSPTTGGTAPVPQETPQAPPPTIRIIGANSGVASVIGGSSLNGATTGQTSAVFSVVKPQSAPIVPSAPRVMPFAVGTTPSSGSVPMSWPGGAPPASNPPTSTPVRQESPPPVSFAARPSEQTRPPQVAQVATVPKPSEQAQSSASGSDSGDSSATVEEQLSKIETKVYGKPTKNMPILKRIEKLEIDTSGKKNSGSIADRLKELKKTYGL